MELKKFSRIDLEKARAVTVVKVTLKTTRWKSLPAEINAYHYVQYCI